MLPRAKGGNIAILGRLPCSKQRYMLLLFQFNQNAVQILWMKENNRLSVSTNLRFWIEHLITHKHQKSWFLCQKEKERERKKGRILLCPSVSNLLLQHICHPPDENYSTSVGAGRKDWMCVCVWGEYSNINRFYLKTNVVDSAGRLLLQEVRNRTVFT